MELKDRIAQRAMDLLGDVVRGWKLSYFGGGPMVKALEAEFEKIHGRPGLAVANCTIGLEMVFRALGARTVLVPANGMAADGLAVKNAGAQIVFCDVDEWGVPTSGRVMHALDSWPIDTVLLVHIGAVSPWAERIAGLCAQRGVRLVEDCAHVMGDPQAGRFGDAAVFSMFATKVLPAGEGGIVTGMPELLRDRQLGREDEWGPCIGTGTNGKMSELNAAFGLAVLEHAEEIIDRRMAACSVYTKELRQGWYGRPGYKYVLGIPDVRKREFLKSQKCLTGPIFGQPLSSQPAFRTCAKIGSSEGFMVGVGKFCREHVCLKTDIDRQEAERIAGIVRRVLEAPRVEVADAGTRSAELQ